FCDDSSRQIVGLLVKEALAAGVEIRVGQGVQQVVPGERFSVRTVSDEYQADSVVIASGGLSIPKMGATDFGHRVAKKFGLKLIAQRPALVLLTFSQADLAQFRSLSGISIDVQASCGAAAFRENLLFTHRGLSGPAILQVSSYWKPGESLVFDLLPDLSHEE